MARPLALALLACVVLAGCTAERPPEPDCSTPRSAAGSLFAWQQPFAFDLARATACVGGDAALRTARASQLKAVLDARRIWAPIDALPEDPDARNADGVHRVTLLDEPPIALARGRDGAWRYTADTMARVPIWHAETFSPAALWLQQASPALSRRFGGFALWQLVFGAGLLAAAWTLARAVRWAFAAQGTRLAARLGVDAEDGRFARLDAPIAWTAFFAVAAWGVPQLQLPIALSDGAGLLATLGFRLGAVVLLFGVITVLSDLAARFAQRTEARFDDQLVPLLRSTAQIVVGCLGLLVLLEAFGVDVWQLVAGASVGGIIVGLAAQDSMKNFFGSLNVFIDQPFQVGDWVVIGGVEGTVEEVGFRSTRIRTFHNSQVTVPNSTITNANVDNMGRRPRRRVKLVVGLTYDTPPDRLQAYAEGVRAILAAHPNVQNTYEVHVWDLGASSIDILVYYHVVVRDWHEELTTRSENLLEFIRLAEALDVSFAFPSQSLYVESTPDHPLPPWEPMSMVDLGERFAAFGPGGERSRPRHARFPRTFDSPEVAAADQAARRGSAGDAGA